MRAIRGLCDAAIECHYNGLEACRIFPGLIDDKVVFVAVFDRCSTVNNSDTAGNYGKFRRQPDPILQIPRSVQVESTLGQ